MGLLYNQQKAKEHFGLVRMKIIFLFMLLGFASMKTRSGEEDEPNRPRKRNAKTTGRGTKTDWAFCTKDKPCGAEGGDCDSDAECADGLQCGFDNCKNFMRMLTNLLTAVNQV